MVLQFALEYSSLDVDSLAEVIQDLEVDLLGQNCFRVERRLIIGLFLYSNISGVLSLEPSHRCCTPHDAHGGECEFSVQVQLERHPFIPTYRPRSANGLAHEVQLLIVLVVKHLFWHLTNTNRMARGKRLNQIRGRKVLLGRLLSLLCLIYFSREQLGPPIFFLHASLSQRFDQLRVEERFGNQPVNRSLQTYYLSLLYCNLAHTFC